MSSAKPTCVWALPQELDRDQAFVLVELSSEHAFIGNRGDQSPVCVHSAAPYQLREWLEHGARASGQLCRRCAETNAPKHVLRIAAPSPPQGDGDGDNPARKRSRRQSGGDGGAGAGAGVSLAVSSTAFAPLEPAKTALEPTGATADRMKKLFAFRTFGFDRCSGSRPTELSIGTFSSWQAVARWAFSETSPAQRPHSMLVHHPTGAGKTATAWAMLGATFASRPKKQFFVSTPFIVNAGSTGPLKDLWAFEATATLPGSPSALAHDFLGTIVPNPKISGGKGSGKAVQWTQWKYGAEGPAHNVLPRVIPYSILGNMISGKGPHGRALYGIEFGGKPPATTGTVKELADRDAVIYKHARPNIVFPDDMFVLKSDAANRKLEQLETEKSATTESARLAKLATAITLQKAIVASFASQGTTARKAIADFRKEIGQTETDSARKRVLRGQIQEYETILSETARDSIAEPPRPIQVVNRPPFFGLSEAAGGPKAENIKGVPEFVPLDPLRDAVLVLDEIDQMYDNTRTGGGIPAVRAQQIEAAVSHSYAVSGTRAVRLVLMTATPFERNLPISLRILNLLQVRPENRVSGVGSGMDTTGGPTLLQLLADPPKRKDGSGSESGGAESSEEVAGEPFKSKAMALFLAGLRNTVSTVTLDDNQDLFPLKARLARGDAVNRFSETIPSAIPVSDIVSKLLKRRMRSMVDAETGAGAPSGGAAAAAAAAAANPNPLDVADAEARALEAEEARRAESLVERGRVRRHAAVLAAKHIAGLDTAASSATAAAAATLNDDDLELLPQGDGRDTTRIRQLITELRALSNYTVRLSAGFPLNLRIGTRAYSRRAVYDAGWQGDRIAPKIAALVSTIRAIDAAAPDQTRLPKHAIITDTAGWQGAPLVAAALDAMGMTWVPFRRFRSTVTFPTASEAQINAIRFSGAKDDTPTDRENLPFNRGTDHFVVLSRQIMSFAYEEEGTAAISVSGAAGLGFAGASAEAERRVKTDYRLIGAFELKHMMAVALGSAVDPSSQGDVPVAVWRAFGMEDTRDKEALAAAIGELRFRLGSDGIARRPVYVDSVGVMFTAKSSASSRAIRESITIDDLENPGSDKSVRAGHELALFEILAPILPPRVRDLGRKLRMADIFVETESVAAAVDGARRGSKRPVDEDVLGSLPALMPASVSAATSASAAASDAARDRVANADGTLSHSILRWEPTLTSSQAAAVVKETLDLFNDTTNVLGRRARVVVVGKGFTTGLDLNDVQFVHLLDSPATERDDIQFTGRAWRRCGHKELRRQLATRADGTVNPFADPTVVTSIEYRLEHDTGVSVDNIEGYLNQHSALPMLVGRPVSLGGKRGHANATVDDLISALAQDPREEDLRVALKARTLSGTSGWFGLGRSEPAQVAGDTFTGYKTRLTGERVYRTAPSPESARRLVGVAGVALTLGAGREAGTLLESWKNGDVTPDFIDTPAGWIADAEQYAIETRILDYFDNQIRDIAQRRTEQGQWPSEARAKPERPEPELHRITKTATGPRKSPASAAVQRPWATERREVQEIARSLGIVLRLDRVAELYATSFFSGVSLLPFMASMWKRVAYISGVSVEPTDHSIADAVIRTVSGAYPDTALPVLFGVHSMQLSGREANLSSTKVLATIMSVLGTMEIPAVQRELEFYSSWGVILANAIRGIKIPRTLAAPVAVRTEEVRGTFAAMANDNQLKEWWTNWRAHLRALFQESTSRSDKTAPKGGKDLWKIFADIYIDSVTHSSLTDTWTITTKKPPDALLDFVNRFVGPGSTSEGRKSDLRERVTFAAKLQINVVPFVWAYIINGGSDGAALARTVTENPQLRARANDAVDRVNAKLSDADDAVTFDDFMARLTKVQDWQMAEQELERGIGLGTSDTGLVIEDSSGFSHLGAPMTWLNGAGKSIFSNKPMIAQGTKLTYDVDGDGGASAAAAAAGTGTGTGGRRRRIRKSDMLDPRWTEGLADPNKLPWSKVVGLWIGLGHVRVRNRAAFTEVMSADALTLMMMWAYVALLSAVAPSVKGVVVDSAAAAAAASNIADASAAAAAAAGASALDVVAAVAAQPAPMKKARVVDIDPAIRQAATVLAESRDFPMEVISRGMLSDVIVQRFGEWSDAELTLDVIDEEAQAKAYQRRDGDVVRALRTQIPQKTYRDFIVALSRSKQSWSYFVTSATLLRETLLPTVAVSTVFDLIPPPDDPASVVPDLDALVGAAIAVRDAVWSKHTRRVFKRMIAHARLLGFPKLNPPDAILRLFLQESALIETHDPDALLYLIQVITSAVKAGTLVTMTSQQQRQAKDRTERAAKKVALSSIHATTDATRAAAKQAEEAATKVKDDTLTDDTSEASETSSTAARAAEQSASAAATAIEHAGETHPSAAEAAEAAALAGEAEDRAERDRVKALVADEIRASAQALEGAVSTEQEADAIVEQIVEESVNVPTELMGQANQIVDAATAALTRIKMSFDEARISLSEANDKFHIPAINVASVFAKQVMENLDSIKDDLSELRDARADIVKLAVALPATAQGSATEPINLGLLEHRTISPTHLAHITSPTDLAGVILSSDAQRSFVWYHDSDTDCLQPFSGSIVINGAMVDASDICVSWNSVTL